MTRLVVQTTPEQEDSLNQFCEEFNTERSKVVRMALAAYFMKLGYTFPLNNPPRMADVNHEIHIERLKEKLDGKREKP